MHALSRLATIGIAVLLPVLLLSVVANGARAADQPLFKLTVNDQPAVVHEARVATGDDALRWTEMDDLTRTDSIFELAAFANVDVDDTAHIQIDAGTDVRTAKVLPAALGLSPAIEGRVIRFDVANLASRPRQLTIEINGDPIHSLHLFLNPKQTSAPTTSAANLIYFPPGVHDLSESLNLGDDQTLYLADGAILRFHGKGDAAIHARGKHIRIAGRGIVVGTDIPIHGRTLLRVEDASDVQISGITLNDSAVWTLELRRSEHVSIDNVKIFGHRSNSDGIDIVNSRDVQVSNCFVRTLDDLIVIKTDRGQGTTERVNVRGCVLWNQVAHALSIGPEVRENVNDVTFDDCDVIHDIGREWTMRVFHSDASTISRVRFSNIRVEQSRLLISLWIGKSFWSLDNERGHVDDVTFEHITAVGQPAKVEMFGFDEVHRITRVKLNDVVINGAPLVESSIVRNPFVEIESIR